jgi:hypothetical protein
MTTIDENRLAFLRGVLAAIASSGQVVHYDEIRRLCRLSKQQLGAYLGEARKRMIAAGQPDFASIVVNDGGWPGDRWSQAAAGTDPRQWAKELRKTHRFWQDRRRLDNHEFKRVWKDLPEEPGL